MKDFANILYQVTFSNPNDFARFATAVVPKIFQILSTTYPAIAGEDIRFWHSYDELRTKLDVNELFIDQLNIVALNGSKGPKPADYVHEIEMYAGNDKFPVKFIWSRVNYRFGILMYTSLVVPADQIFLRYFSKCWLDENVLKNLDFVRQINVVARPPYSMRASGAKNFVIYRKKNLCQSFKFEKEIKKVNEVGSENGDYMLPYGA